MSVMRFSVPGPPYPWPRPRFRRCGSKLIGYESAECKAAKARIGWAAAKAMGPGRIAPTVPVSVALMFRIEPPASWSARKRQLAYTGAVVPAVRPDLDNYVKTVLDACNAIMWDDDGKVVAIVASKVYAIEAGTDVNVRYLEVSTDAPHA